MATNCVDDWENMEIQDLIVNLQDTIKNREKELKLLEERKRIEEAELALSEELFYEEKINKRTNDNLALDEPIKFIKEKKELQIEQEKRHQELQEKKKKQSQKQKEKKKQEKRLKDIYGEVELDEYDDIQCNIEDKYC